MSGMNRGDPPLKVCLRGASWPEEPICGRYVLTGTRVCPHCGYEFYPSRAKTEKPRTEPWPFGQSKGAK